MHHNDIRDELYRQLTQIGGIPEHLVKHEDPVDHPIREKTRVPDVKIPVGPVEFKGIVFDVKTCKSKGERWRALGQLFEYRLAGWHPVVVAKEDVFRPRTEGKLNFNHISSSLNLSWVKFSGEDALKFELMYDHMPRQPGLPHPIGDVDFHDWKRLFDSSR